MAKINHFLVEYRTAICIKTMPEKLPKVVIKRFIDILDGLDDARIQGMISYPLSEIVFIVFIASLADTRTWVEIERFARTKEEWFRKVLKLEHGIPSHDTIRRVFGMIDKDQLQEATITFLQENLATIKKSLNIEETGLTHIAVDGKEQRGTGRLSGTDDEVKNLQTLHVYDVSNGIVLSSEAISEKTNEIPVAQKILNTMNLKNCIVTFDALHTQKETVRIIASKGGIYVGGLKGNQMGLFEEAGALFTEKAKETLSGKGLSLETKEKAHNQIETRKYYMIKKPKASFNGEKSESAWTDLKSILCYEKTVENLRTGEKKTENRFYITNAACNPDNLELCAEAIRGHWGIENNLHWQLDSSFEEDQITTMDSKAFNNLSLIHKMALTLCKIAKPALKCPSINVFRKLIGWDFDKTMAALFSLFDEDSLKLALTDSNAKESNVPMP